MRGGRRLELPAVEVWVCFDDSTQDSSALIEWAGRYPDTDPCPDRHPDDVVAIIPAGGTIGPSKGAMLTTAASQPPSRT
ncbi:hypothetical protein [Amycolatopsis sp. GM8]|uniref:hypothetical protein n=1 Tax=Amycolatopsis sp. GM8 TaxID=2896530 RepID=UPI001F318DFD|nr:hypothetical protein [Amycolatopsis sp. GM8]